MCNLREADIITEQWGFEQPTSSVFEQQKLVGKLNGLLLKPWPKKQTKSSLFERLNWHIFLNIVYNILIQNIEQNIMKDLKLMF